MRQSLYRHTHCVNSNTYKAIAAADVLREIHPEIVRINKNKIIKYWFFVYCRVIIKCY